MTVYLIIRAQIALGTSANIKEISDLAIDMAQKLYPFVQFILWGIITLLTLFFLQMNDKFGPGILKKFLLGKYNRPKKEARIFMFLDMKYSTTIAEKIGNEKYFHLLSSLIFFINHSRELCRFHLEKQYLNLLLSPSFSKKNRGGAIIIIIERVNFLSSLSQFNLPSFFINDNDYSYA